MWILRKIVVQIGGIRDRNERPIVKLLHDGEYSENCEVVGEFLVAGDEESFERTTCGSTICIKWNRIVPV